MPTIQLENTTPTTEALLRKNIDAKPRKSISLRRISSERGAVDAGGAVVGGISGLISGAILSTIMFMGFEMRNTGYHFLSASKLWADNGVNGLSEVIAATAIGGMILGAITRGYQAPVDAAKGLWGGIYGAVGGFVIATGIYMTLAMRTTGFHLSNALSIWSNNANNGLSQIITIGILAGAILVGAFKGINNTVEEKP